MRWIILWLVWFAVHFLLVMGVACRETLWLMGRAVTILPASLESSWRKAESIAAATLGENLGRTNPARQTISAYLHFAGIESGYGFFAPNVPDSYKLVFELHYADGRIEYEQPGVEGMESNVRLASLMDEIGRTTSDPMREVMMKLLAHSIWQQHPDAVMIRAILGSLTLPTVTEFQQGKSETYEFLYAYDFTLSESAPEPQPR